MRARRPPVHRLCERRERHGRESGAARICAPPRSCASPMCPRFLTLGQRTKPAMTAPRSMAWKPRVRRSSPSPCRSMAGSGPDPRGEWAGHADRVRRAERTARRGKCARRAARGGHGNAVVVPAGRVVSVRRLAVALARSSAPAWAVDLLRFQSRWSTCSAPSPSPTPTGCCARTCGACDSGANGDLQARVCGSGAGTSGGRPRRRARYSERASTSAIHPAAALAARPAGQRPRRGYFPEPLSTAPRTVDTR